MHRCDCYMLFAQGFYIVGVEAFVRQNNDIVSVFNNFFCIIDVKIKNIINHFCIVSIITLGDASTINSALATSGIMLSTAILIFTAKDLIICDLFTV